jgi:hypothetical protein
VEGILNSLGWSSVKWEAPRRKVHRAFVSGELAFVRVSMGVERPTSEY